MARRSRWHYRWRRPTALIKHSFDSANRRPAYAAVPSADSIFATRSRRAIRRTRMSATEFLGAVSADEASRLGLADDLEVGALDECSGVFGFPATEDILLVRPGRAVVTKCQRASGQIASGGSKHEPAMFHALCCDQRIGKTLHERRFAPN